MNAVSEWKRCENTTEVKIFLDLVGYYHHFIEKFSIMVTPLTELTHKDMKFIWTEDCQKVFWELKVNLQHLMF